MKTPLYVLFILIVLSACSGKEKYQWPSSALPEFEELCGVLDSLYYRDLVEKEGQLLALKLDTLSRGSDMTRTDRARALYWMAETGINHDSTDSWLEQAAVLTDSSAYPYLFNRIIIANRHFDTDSYLDYYSKLKRAVDYFVSLKRNKYDILFAYRHLGTFFLRIGDIEDYNENALTLERLCREIGDSVMLSRSRLNFALGAIKIGDTVRAKNVIAQLMRDPMFNNDSDMMGRLYVNMGELTHDARCYAKAIEISPVFRNEPSFKHSLELAMMRCYEERGEYDRSDSLFLWLAPIVEAEGDATAKGILYSIKSRQARGAGDFKTALEYKERSKIYFDSAFTADHRNIISREQLAYELTTREKLIKSEKMVIRYLVAGAIIVFLILLVAAFYYVRNHRNIMKIRQLQSEADLARSHLELEKKKRTVIAMDVVLTERNNMAKEVMSLADELHRNGDIDGRTKNDLARVVQVSNMNNQELTNFQQLYPRIDPRFISKIKEIYPDLSEGDVKLAACISIGLSSKQIARILHLQPDSVKKNRQRLRKRMCLDSSQSLEKVIRELV